MSLEEFEKQLSQQMTGHELEIIKLRHYYMEREVHIKQKAAFRIDVQEQAMRELKIQLRR